MSTIILTPQASPSSGTHRRKNHEVSYFHHIDGIRGLAIALVVIFHVFVGKVSSGVDVFLFIGGLLFVASQTKNAVNPRGITVIQGLVRILRRLYPSLILVVLVSLVATLIVFPQTLHKDAIEHAAASVLSVVNIAFMVQGDDYVRAGQGSDAFQHLWSMSAQLQIYVAILLIISLCVFLLPSTWDNDKRKKMSTRVVGSVITVLTALSLFYATMMVSHDQDANYYNTLSRFWEIGLGSLVGMFVMHRVILSPILRWFAGVTGLALIVCSGIFLDGVSVFPGAWTLVPLGGAFLLIISGNTFPTEKRTISSLGIVTYFLETTVMKWMGKISYSLYLWHWPVLLILGAVIGKEYSDPLVGIPVIIISLVLAYVTYKYVETPLRQSRKPKRTPLSGMFSPRYYNKNSRIGHSIAAVVCVLSSFAMAISPVIYNGIQMQEQRQLDRQVEALGGYDEVYPGAQALLASQSTRDDVPILPQVNNLEDMLPMTQKDQCFSTFDNNDLVLTKNNGRPCEYGDTSSKKTMYVIGGSHSEMYIPALDTIGKNRGIKIIPIIKMGCAFYQDTKFDESPYPGCLEWSDKLVDYVLKNPPTEGIFHTSTRPSDIVGYGPEVVPGKYVETMRKFSDAGIKSYLMRDIPWMVMGDHQQKDVRICVSDFSEKGYDIRDCGQKASDFLLPEDPSKNAYAGIPNIQLMDINSGIISDDWVNPVVGNVLVYRDSHHLTNMFVNSLTPLIEQQMFTQITTPYPTPTAPLNTEPVTPMPEVGSEQTDIPQAPVVEPVVPVV